MLFILNEVMFDLSRIDSFGLIVAAVGYVIVFCSLVLLYYVFSSLPRIINIKIRSRLRKEGKEFAEEDDFSVTGEVNAAISTALFLYFNEMHDEESNIITIRKVSKTYSPWSSKIYGLRNFNPSKF
ncbi:MAG: OadG family protein [Bacteroidales bacterium]|nr:OadG family protein [Bacteroidales bacterium]MCF8454981.1 OadG family protein [Bacteroidales bacterium]